MDYGRYFRLDTDASDLGREGVVFCYRPDGERDCPTYAIITDAGIEFYIVGPKTNGRVLYIPLDDNFDLNIAETLAGNYARVIHVPEKTEYVKSMAPGGDPDGYFALFYRLWKKSPQAPVHPWACWMDDTKDDFPVAKLVLDFLYDLQETRIFQMSPQYVKMSEKLHSNFFFHALAAKAKYLHERKTHDAVSRTNNKNIPGRDRKQRRETKNFFGGLFFKAEKEWTTCIRDTRSDMAFYKSNGWFDDSEAEMMRVYKPRAILHLEETHNQEKKENDKGVAKWLVARYSSFKVWRIFFGGQRSFFGLHLFYPRLMFSIGTAWLTSVLAQKVIPFQVSHVKPNMKTFICLFLVLIFSASWIVVKKIVPLGRGIVVKALKLTGIVILFALIIGRLFYYGLFNEKIDSEDLRFLWIWSAFAGLAVQYFVQGTNPSESI